MGAAADGQQLFTWGDRLLRWSLRTGERLDLGHGPFLEGGCFQDADHIVLNIGPRRPALIRIDTSSQSRRLIDTGVLASDILPVTLHGRRGVLVVHRGGQVRFYEVPPDPAQHWPMQEVYSFYSPSRQGGIALTDVDGDGFTDILCGNYWIQSPHRPDLPWRLFAIELWNELPPSAMLRLAWVDGKLIAAQREMQDARFAWFEKPKDPKQLWIEHPIVRLNQPNSLDAADLDGDGNPEILVAERGGAGRLIIVKGRELQIVTHGSPIVYARALDGGILTVSREAITRWTQGS